MSGLQDQARRAKARLSEMMVQEVSLVDAAANLRKFVLTKRDGMATTEKMTLKLPGDAKQGIMDGIAQTLDKLTALATMVGDAEVDDAAGVPPELCAALSQSAEMIEGMATQYGAAAAEAPAAPGQGEPPPPPASGEAPAAGKAAGDPAAKALPPECHQGDSMKSELHDGDSLKTLLHKAIAAAHVEIAGVEKAGRKMAGARYKKLADLHDTLGKLLNELAYDEASEGGAAAPAKAEGVGKSAAPATSEEKLADIVKAAKETQETLAKKLGELDGKVATISKAAGLSNAGSVEGASVEKPVEGWASDMSKVVADKREKRRQQERAAR